MNQPHAIGLEKPLHGVEIRIEPAAPDMFEHAHGHDPVILALLLAVVAQLEAGAV